jgi:hypothetical protein
VLVAIALNQYRQPDRITLTGSRFRRKRAERDHTF